MLTKRDLVAWTVGAAALGGFGPNSALAQAQTILRVATAPSIYQKSHEALAAEFQRQNPTIRVDLIPAVREDEELVQRTLRSALTGDLPDVLFISPNVMRSLIDRQLAVPLESIGATAAELDALGLVAGATGVGEVGGKLYGLPYGVSTPLIAYNADLVRRAGGDAEAFPKTWPDTVALARRVGKLGAGTIGGFFEYDNTGNWTYKALVATLGGRMMSPDDKAIAFDGAEGLEALRVLQAFGEAGQARVDMTRDQARQAFAAGTMGLIVTSSGSLPGLERQAAGRFALRAAPLPLAGPHGRVPAAGTVIMVLSRDPAKARAAWDYAKFAVSPDMQTLLGTQTGLLSVSRIALGDPNRLGAQVKERPNQQAALDQLSRLTDWYAFPGENSIKITAVIKDHLQAVLTLKQTPSAALAAMKRDVEALLPRP